MGHPALLLAALRWCGIGDLVRGGRRLALREVCWLRFYKTSHSAEERGMDDLRSWQEVGIEATLGCDGFQSVGAVEGIALRWNVAGIGDDAAQFLLVRAIADACGVDDIFFDQNTAYIIRTELQP
jgi:hypothetical protein